MSNTHQCVTGTLDTRWSDLKLHRTVEDTLESQGFTHLTPVQQHTIPAFLGHKDVAVQACTGSGKTLAFVVPVIELLLRCREEGIVHAKGQVAALLIAPIRELANQVFEVLEPFAAACGFTAVKLVGGKGGLSTDRKTITTAQKETGNTTIVVGTPGKLKACLYASPPVFSTRSLEVLVLDEADRLLEMGFMRELNMILAKLPKQRRTGLFSATQTKEVKQLVRAGLRNPFLVNVKVLAPRNDSGAPASATEDAQMEEVKDLAIPASLKNCYTICEVDQKMSQLTDFLVNHAGEKIIVYFLTCAQVNFMWNALSKLNLLKDHNLLSLHGKVPHAHRTAIYNKYTTSPAAVLFTTDVAARGLDIPDVQWIVQYDPPQDPNAFVHRIGRTARMGKEGSALVYLAPHEDNYIDFMRNKRVPMEEVALAEDAVDVLPLVRNRVEKQRELMDKGQLAFVSFIRAYKEHKCNYIFRLKKMDMGRLATGFVLLRLPKMPELPAAEKLENFTPSTVNVEKIPYLDKVREKRRKQQLEERKIQESKREKVRTSLKAVKVIKKNEAWSSKKKIKAAKKGQAVAESLEEATENILQNEDDWAEIAKESRLKKKLKRKKITKAQFQAAMDELDLDFDPPSGDTEMKEA